MYFVNPPLSGKEKLFPLLADVQQYCSNCERLFCFSRRLYSFKQSEADPIPITKRHRSNSRARAAVFIPLVKVVFTTELLAEAESLLFAVKCLWQAFPPFHSNVIRLNLTAFLILKSLYGIKACVCHA